MTTSESIDQIAAVPINPFVESKITGSTAQAELTAAMVKVQAAIEDPPKDQRNTALNSSRYAGLQSGLPGYRRLLAENGVWMFQAPTSDQESEKVSLTTRLQHVSGEWMELCLSAEPPNVPVSDKGTSRVNQVQMLVLTVTYLRRCSNHALLNIAGEDNDGNTIGGESNANTVHDLGIGTAPKAAAEASPAGEGAAAPAQESAPSADVSKKVLQSLLMDEFARLNADPDAVKANCQKLAGVDTIFELTVEQLETALASIQKVQA